MTKPQNDSISVRAMFEALEIKDKEIYNIQGPCHIEGIGWDLKQLKEKWEHPHRWSSRHHDDKIMEQLVVMDKKADRFIEIALEMNGGKRFMDEVNEMIREDAMEDAGGRLPGYSNEADPPTYERRGV